MLFRSTSVEREAEREPEQGHGKQPARHQGEHRHDSCPRIAVCLPDAPRARRAHTSLAVRVSVRRVLVHSGTGYAAHLLRCPSADRHSAMTHPIIPGAEPWSHVATDGAPGALCIHGFTGNPGSMRGVAEAFAAAGFHVELPMLPGHGTHMDDMLPTGWPD